MPELPEVETFAAGLRPLLVGRTIVAVTVRWPRTIATPGVSEFSQRIAGRQVVSVDRRGKYLVIHLDQGFLLIHLKMSGRLSVVVGDEPLGAHTHTVFQLDNGQQLRFHDTRKFGRVYLVDDLARVTGSLGPEPLAPDYSQDDFCRSLSRRTGRLKSLLLNQEFLAGLGNIYADEALFMARLHPLRQACSLNSDEQARLLEAIRTVLSRAIAGRGTTLDDKGYRDAQGQAGSFQDQIEVYGRTGQPCSVCNTAIRRIVIGGRSSHYCPHCQTN